MPTRDGGTSAKGFDAETAGVGSANGLPVEIKSGSSRSKDFPGFITAAGAAGLAVKVVVEVVVDRRDTADIFSGISSGTVKGFSSMPKDEVGAKVSNPSNNVLILLLEDETGALETVLPKMAFDMDIADMLLLLALFAGAVDVGRNST
jgi:hypothetical protein